MSIKLGDAGTALFIGDSITDCQRDRDQPDSLGDGYVSMAAERLLARNPGSQMRFANRGISGNRTKDLRTRWVEDCLDLEPDVVTILVGINDMWRRYEQADPTPAPVFEDHYRIILSQSAQKGSALVLIEPFLIPVHQHQWAWREDLDPKIGVVRRLAMEFGAKLIAADGLMAQAATNGDPLTWSADGVHPTPAGHSLLADAWLSCVSADG